MQSDNSNLMNEIMSNWNKMFEIGGRYDEYDYNPSQPRIVKSYFKKLLFQFVDNTEKYFMLSEEQYIQWRKLKPKIVQASGEQNA
jgi:hypothetical protein